jgi:hypothetical protein
MTNLLFDRFLQVAAVSLDRRHYSFISQMEIITNNRKLFGFLGVQLKQVGGDKIFFEFYINK